MAISTARVTPAVLERIRQIVGTDGLLSEPERLRTYESDGLTNYQVMPAAVVLLPHRFRASSDSAMS
jgi:glycolate oxidase